MKALLLVVSLFAAVGCDLANETDVAGLIGSQFVVVRLDEGDLAAGAVAASGALNPETFLSGIRQSLGRDPSSLELTRVAVSLGTTGLEGVANWSDVFSSDVSVSFIVDGSPPIVAGSLKLPPAGLADIEGRVLVRRETLDRFPAIRAGRFSVQLSAPSVRSPSEAFVLPARVELEFIVF
jgi:hypothetical protein